MRNKAKSLIAILLLLAVLLIEPLYLNIAAAQQSITGTQDDTLGVWLFSAGTTVPAGAPTDDIIKSAIHYDLLEYIGDSTEEVYDWDYGLSEPATGQEDTTLAEVVEGLSAIDDFGMIANPGDDAANFDTGSGGYFEGGFDLAMAYVIYADGVIADGVVGPNGVTNAEEAEEAIEGYEIFIFEDAELSGMVITLSNKLGLSISVTLDDLQVDPPTPDAADDTMIAIDLDSMIDFDGTYIDRIRIQDDGITQSRTDTGDTTLEIDAIATRTVECEVNFFTDPVDPTFNITYEGETYVDGDSENFTYGTYGWAEAHCPPGWVFDHWEIVGNVALDPGEYANPVTFTITCGGDLKAVFKPAECTVNFYTDPSDVGNITVSGADTTYFNGDTKVYNYSDTFSAMANAPVGWVFDHWVATANLTLSPNQFENPVSVTVKCGGNLTAVFKRGECTVNFYTDPVGSNFNITYESGTYVNGDSDTFTYGTSGLATAHCPPGYVFDHWEIVGNVELSPDEYANPVTFTITCGGDLKAVFTEEHGNGDLGTIGYWKHVFYVWKASKGNFKNYTGQILEWYLGDITVASAVFGENYTLTLESAYDLLWTNPGSNMRRKALRQCFACWLNWANDAVTMSQMVDIDYDGHPDMTFGAAMTIVENILKDPNSSLAELEHAKNICDSINNM